MSGQAWSVCRDCEPHLSPPSMQIHHRCILDRSLPRLQTPLSRWREPYLLALTLGYAAPELLCLFGMLCILSLTQ